MNRLAALLVAFIAAASLDAAGVTIEMVPGSAPQTAHSGAFFLNPLSVIVRDDAGAPIAGTPVELYFDPYASAARVMFLDGADGTFTDANGVATVQMVAWGAPGDVIVRVVSTGAAINLPPLTVVGKPPAQMAYVSGANQTVYPGDVFGQAFTVKAVDADGNAVPYALVDFTDAHLDGWANSTFDGQFDATAMADANGVASLRFTAGPVFGRGVVNAIGFGMSGTPFYYTVVTRPIAGTAEPWRVPPMSLERWMSTIVPFTVVLRDQYGALISGAPVTFATSPDCGSFEGAATAIVTSDANGYASSPPFTALSSEVYCSVTLEINPESRLQWDIYEFSADHVVIGNLPASLEIAPAQPFTLVPTFTADGVGIYPLPISVDVTTAPNGASATLANEPITRLDSNHVNLYFNANNKTGNRYTITVRRGPVQATVEVKQSGK